MSELTIGAAQAISRRGEVDANLAHHGQLAELAARQGVEILVFPELSLTGYEPDIAADLAFSAQDERLAPLRDVAAAHDITLVVGAPIRLTSGLHIGAFLLEHDRSMRIYTKRYLHGGEHGVFVAGSLDPVLEHGTDRALVAICADTSHPEHAEAAAKRGASLYLAGVFFTPEGCPDDAVRLAGHAARHRMAVVMANAGGPATGFASGGASAVWSESGALVAGLNGPGAGLVIARRSDAGWKGEALLL